MQKRYEGLEAAVQDRFGERLSRVDSICAELTYELAPDNLVEVARQLRDEEPFNFDMLVDICGVDYLVYGEDEWKGRSASETGFSRGAIRDTIIPDAYEEYDPERFAVVYHLQSIRHNTRIRLRVYTGSGNPPIVPSVYQIWNAADWYEREAFDLFGILFEGHPDLRRLLTDYGFIGHPFRKDFPLIGNVEVRYDPEKQRVVYEPVSIEPRTLVPKVIRDDSRYQNQTAENGSDG